MSVSSPAANAQGDLREEPTAAIVAVALLATAATTSIMSTFPYLSGPAQSELHLSVDTFYGIMAVMPAAASLILVFVVGSLGDRLGARRVILAGALGFCAEAVLVRLAPNAVTLALGQVLGGIGGTLMTVTAVAMIRSGIHDTDRRARVFGLYAAVAPAVAIVAPPVAAALVQAGGWRTVPLLWLVPGLFVVVLTMWKVPDGGSGSKGELLTPLMAGVALASASLAIAAGLHAPAVTVVLLCIAVMALVVLGLLRRRSGFIGLDLRVLRDRRSWPVLLAMFVGIGVNFYLMVNMYLRYRYPDSLTGSAVLLTLPLLASMAGGVLGGRLAARIGAGVASMLLLFAASITCLGVLAVRRESPPWVVVAALTIAVLPLAGSIATLTQAYMNLAPADGAGAASSIRSAVGELRNVIFGGLVGAVVFSRGELALADALERAGVGRDNAGTVAAQLREGETLESVVNNPLLGLAPVRDLFLGPATAVREAQVHALHVAGIVTAAAYLVAALAMVVSLRRGDTRRTD